MLRSAGGEPKALNASSKTSKADLVAALKESFAICDAAYDSLTDASATEMIKTARGQRSKLGALVGTQRMRTKSTDIWRSTCV